MMPNFESFEAFCEFIEKYAELERILDFIKADNERLTAENDIVRRYLRIETDEQTSKIVANYKGIIAETKSETRKEFAERLQDKAQLVKTKCDLDKNYFTNGVLCFDIYQLLIEMESEEE